MKIDFGFALGIYTIGLALVKGWRTKELRDVFNFRNTKELIERYTWKDSLFEYLCLFLVFLNSLLLGGMSYTIIEYIWVFFLVAAVYRFIFWGITHAIRNGN